MNLLTACCVLVLMAFSAFAQTPSLETPSGGETRQILTEPGTLPSVTPNSQDERATVLHVGAACEWWDLLCKIEAWIDRELIKPAGVHRIDIPCGPPYPSCDLYPPGGGGGNRALKIIVYTPDGPIDVPACSLTSAGCPEGGGSMYP